MPKGYGAISKIVAVGAILLGALLAKPIGEFVGRTVVRQYMSGTKEAAISELTLQAAQTLAKQVPIQLDEITTLYAVVAVGNTIMYHHRLSIEVPSNAAQKFLTRQRAALIARVCGSQDTRFGLEHGMKMKYLYVDILNNPIGAIEVTDSHCPHRNSSISERNNARA
jgi:hypothetical protein